MSRESSPQEKAQAELFKLAANPPPEQTTEQLRQKIQDLLVAGADVNAKNLLVAGADVNAKNRAGVTALMFASSRGHVAVVDHLIAAGADVNAVNSFGRTEMMLASSRGHAAVVGHLIAAGADVNVQDKNGMTALMFANLRGCVDVIYKMVAMGVVISDEQLALALPHIREGMGMAEFQGEVEGKIRGICTTIQSGEDIKGSLVELQSFFASKDEEKKAVEEKRDVSNLDTIMGANGFYGKVLNIIGGYPCDDGKQESFKSLLKALNSQNKHRPMVGFTENGHANSVVGELAQAYYANVKKAGFLKKSVEDSKEEGRNLFVQQENPAPAPDGALTLPEILAIGPVALAVSNFLSHRSNANLILTGGAIDYAEKAMMVAQTNRKDCNRNAELVAKITGIPAEEQTLFNPQGKIISSIQGLNRSLDDCRTSLGGNHMHNMIEARRDANSVSQGRSA